MSSEWRETRLRDLIEHTRDGEWGSDQPSASRVEMLVVRGTDFARLRIGDLSETPHRYIERGAAERKQLRADDVLIETAGGTKEQSTGRTALVKSSHIKQAGIPLTCSSFARFIRFDRNKVEPAYIYWWLQSLHAAGVMEQHQVQHTGVARFQFTEFAENTAAPLPSLPTQRAIARILGALDDKIELNRKMNETLEQMARTIFKSWFVDFEPFRDHGMADSPLGRIPKGWKVGVLDEVAANPRRSVGPADIRPGTPYIALEHMPRRSICLADWSLGDTVESGKSAFRQGELLFGKLRPYFHKVGVAPLDGVCSTDIVVVTPKAAHWLGYVLGHVSSDAFVAYTNAGSEGTKMPRTSWTRMAAYRIAIPSDDAASTFNTVIAPALERITRNIWQSRTLAAIRDALLPKLMSGEAGVLV